MKVIPTGDSCLAPGAARDFSPRVNFQCRLLQCLYSPSVQFNHMHHCAGGSKMPVMTKSTASHQGLMLLLDCYSLIWGDTFPVVSLLLVCTN